MILGMWVYYGIGKEGNILGSRKNDKTLCLIGVFEWRTGQKLDPSLWFKHCQLLAWPSCVYWSTLWFKHWPCCCVYWCSRCRHKHDSSSSFLIRIHDDVISPTRLHWVVVAFSTCWIRLIGSQFTDWPRVLRLTTVRLRLTTHWPRVLVAPSTCLRLTTDRHTCALDCQVNPHSFVEKNVLLLQQDTVYLTHDNSSDWNTFIALRSCQSVLNLPVCHAHYIVYIPVQ